MRAAKSNGIETARIDRRLQTITMRASAS